MPHAKKIRDDLKKFDHVEEKLTWLGARITTACFFYDMTPGGDHDMEKDYAEFIKLLIYCNEKKLYISRDRALKRVLSTISE